MIGTAELRDEFAVVAAARHEDSRKLLAFWNARGPDGIVMGRDLPSRAIAALLSHLMVWEPAGDMTDMHVRLAGSALMRRFPGDLRGRLMSELFPQQTFAELLRGTKRVIQSGAPEILDLRVTSGKIERLHLEVVVLPIRSPDRKRSWVLVGAFCFE